MILTPDSIAKNTAIGSTSLSDQRGFPMVGVPDIGACEAGNANSYTTWSWDMTGSAYADPLGDPDKDDSTNFYEYATLTDPLVRNTRIEPGFDQILAQTDIVVDTLTLKVRRNHENLIYTIEQSNNLTLWSRLATYDSANDKLDGSSSATATMDAGDIFTVRASNSFTGLFVGKFFRVKFAEQQ